LVFLNRHVRIDRKEHTMSDHEQHENEELEDLEPTAEDTEKVAGGAVKVSDIPITKYVDKPSP
jgi:hypothetical protein